MIELTFSVANATNCDVFRVFEQDMSVVIDVINYLVERAEGEQEPMPEQRTAHDGAKTRVRDTFWDYV